MRSLLSKSPLFLLLTACNVQKDPPARNKAESADLTGDPSPIEELTTDHIDSTMEMYAKFTPRPKDHVLTSDDLDKLKAIQVNFLLTPDSPLISEAEKGDPNNKSKVYEDEGPSNSFTFIFDSLSLIKRSIHKPYGICGNGLECSIMYPDFPSSFRSTADETTQLAALLKSIEILTLDSMTKIPTCVPPAADFSRSSVERARLFHADSTYSEVWFAKECRNRDGTMGSVPIGAVTWARDNQLNKKIGAVLSSLEKSWQKSLDYAQKRRAGRAEVESKCHGDNEYCHCLRNKETD